MSYSSVIKIREQIAEFEYLKEKVSEKEQTDETRKMLSEINSAINDLQEEVRYLLGLPNKEQND